MGETSRGSSTIENLGPNMATTVNFPTPSPMEMTGDLLQNWTFFRAQYENYEVATGLNKKSDDIRVATLLSLMGKECFRIYTHLDMGEVERKKVSTILTALEGHFAPTRNVIYERYKFNTCEQNQGESVAEYITKLRQLASTCDFGVLENDLLRDRLVLGTKDAGARARMLREPNLDLQKAIDMCRSSEISKSQLKDMSNEQETVNYSVSNGGKGKLQKSTTAKHSGAKPKPKKELEIIACKYCGGKHKKDKQLCPAYGQVCRNCNLKNHFFRVCKQREKASVNRVDDDPSDSDDSTFHVEHSVGTVRSAGEKWFVTLNLRTDDTPVRGVTCQMDSGSTCNILSFKEYCRIAHDGNPNLSMSNAKLRLYDGNVMVPMGICKLNCKLNGNTHELEFQVVDIDQIPLLSAKTCEHLGLLTVHVNQNVYSVEQTDIVAEYPDVFTGLGCLPGEYHIEIDSSVKPVQHQPRKVAVALKPELHKKINELEQKGVLAKVTTPTDWISSMVAVRKPSGKLRICLDPQDLNKALKRPHYPMPTVEEILPNLSNAKIFSILDAKDGFWQVQLDEPSSYLTTFWTPFGRYRWLRMPFGISTAPEEFQRRQHEVFEGLSGVAVIADDVLVYGSGDTVEEATADHDKNLMRVLERARKCNLKINKQKLKLRQTEVSYMGHLLTSQGVCPDPRKVQAVNEMPKPDSIQAVQRFLGFVNYLAKFLPHLSDVSEPLRRLTDKDSIWCWQTKHDTAFNTIKKLVTESPVLRYYDMTEEVTIQCDASDTGLGAALLQKGQPVAFASRTLTATERRYAVIEKECLAIVFATEHFDQYIHGRDCVNVRSDHKPLEIIFKKPLLSAPQRLQRMLLRLQKYNLNVTYQKGTEMYIADTLSRAALTQKAQGNVTPAEQVFQIEQQTPFEQFLESINHAEFLRVTDDRLRQIQQQTVEDTALQVLKTTILTGWPETKEEVPLIIREYWAYRDELTVQNGVLYKGPRVIIPKSMRPEMLVRIHSSHLGPQSCLRKARDVLYWPNMSNEIKDMIGQCSACNEYQQSQCKEPLMTHEIPDRPWSRVAMDIFSLEGEDYLITVDYYSDFWEVDKLSNVTSKTVINCSKVHFSRYGVPDVVVSDNGGQFDSDEFREFARDWEFEHVTTSPYHSQSNGKVESAVKIAKKVMKKAKRSGQDVWKAILDWRNTPTENMASSPAQRLMSRRTRTLLPTANQLLMPQVVENVPGKIEQRRQKAKQYYDRGSKELPQLKIGEQVRVKPSPSQRDKRWRLGTCQQQLSPRSYIVDVGGREFRRNRKFLRTTQELQPDNSEPEPPDQIELDIPEEPVGVTAAPVEAAANRTSGTVVPDAVCRTRTRVVKRPGRFSDYV